MPQKLRQYTTENNGNSRLGHFAPFSPTIKFLHMHIFVKDESELVQICLYTYYRVVVGSNPVHVVFSCYVVALSCRDTTKY